MRAAVWAVCAVLWAALGAEGGRILAVLPTNTRSHYAMYGRLLDALARRGHHLTVISHFSMKNPPLNVDEISVAGTIPELANNLTSERTMKPEFIRNLEQIMVECVHACDVLSKAPNVRALLNSTESFDLVIVEVFGSECFLPLGRRFKAPVVGLLSSVPLPWVNEQLGNPEATAYVPAYMMGYGQRMNLWERFLNTLSVQWAKIIYRMKSQLPSQIIADRMFGPGPRLEDLAKNYSLVLANSHFSINDVRPISPSYIEVGGLHLDDSQTLPKDLQQLLDRSTEGVIWWSFGSMSRIETIPMQTLSQIFGVLGQLPHAVMIKMNRNMLPQNVTVPDNVYTRDWMPQYKTLCHPNMKVFISHGGLLGTQEAVACGVPMLVVPLYADQALNARAMSDRGVAKVLQFNQINKANFEDSLLELINDPKYKQRALELSNVFLDRPLPPLETGIYWIEYVMRHSGAHHLRSPSLDLSLVEYLLVDVLALSIIIVGTIFSILFILLRTICNKYVKWWPIERFVFEQNLFKKSSVLLFMLIKYKLKAN